jgi:hypothetical protein
MRRKVQTFPAETLSVEHRKQITYFGENAGKNFQCELAMSEGQYLTRTSTSRDCECIKNRSATGFFLYVSRESPRSAEIKMSGAGVNLRSRCDKESFANRSLESDFTNRALPFSRNDGNAPHENSN